MDFEKIKKTLKIFYDRHKRMPTHGEMVKLFHYTSRGSTHYLVKRLIAENIVEKDAQGKLLPKNLYTIPLLGIIKAGYPMPVEVQRDSLNLHTLFSEAAESSFALTVSGDSMIEAGINEGDYVIVNAKKEAHTGDIVAACVDGEWTVKYLEKNKDGGIVLMPANELYNPIYPKETLTIGGVVVNVIRKY